MIDNRIEEYKKSKSGHLDLSNCELKSIPKAIERCSDLTMLDLSKNRIKRIEFDFTIFPNLRHLFLGYNKLEVFPNEILELHALQTLSLKRNRLKIIPNSISQLTELHTLNLSNNELTLIPEGIGELSNLSNLTLYGNKLGLLPRDMNRLNARIDIDDAMLLKNVFGEDAEWNKGVWKIPEEYRMPIKQYLIFFEQFFKKSTGKDLRFEIHSHKDGLEIRVKENDNINGEVISEQLNNYVGFIGEKTDFDAIEFTSNLDMIEKKLLIQELKSEVEILKLRLENSSFRENLLMSTNNQLYNISMNLSSNAPILTVNNNHHIQQSNYTEQNQILENNFSGIIEVLDSLKAESRDALLENEIEKIVAVIEESLKGKSKKEIKKTGVLYSLRKFIEKLESNTSNLSKSIKNIERISKKVSKLKSFLLTLTEYIG